MKIALEISYLLGLAFVIINYCNEELRYYLNQALRNHGCTTGIGDESGCFPETTNHIYENVSFEVFEKFEKF